MSLWSINQGIRKWEADVGDSDSKGGEGGGFCVAVAMAWSPDGMYIESLRFLWEFFLFFFKKKNEDIVLNEEFYQDRASRLLVSHLVWLFFRFRMGGGFMCCLSPSLRDVKESVYRCR